MATQKKQTESLMSFSKGDVLMREGDPSGDLWIIRTGSVEVFRERRGKQIVLAVLEAGEMLGTMTAITGGPRCGSVRALSDGTAMVVSEEQVQNLVKGLPAWAFSFVKDLVGRVNYANKLYIDTESSRSTGIVESPIAFAIRFSKTFIALTDAIVVKKENLSFIPIDANLELFGQALGDREEVKVIVDLLFKHGLLNDVPGVGKGRHVALSEVGNIALFSDLLTRFSADYDPKTPFVLPFAVNERKMLLELSKLGSDPSRSGEQSMIVLRHFEDHLKKMSLNFELQTLVRASKLGLLSIDKSDDEATVVFDSQWLDFSLKSLQVVRDLIDPKSMRSNEYKRTLLY